MISGSAVVIYVLIVPLIRERSELEAEKKRRIIDNNELTAEIKELRDKLDMIEGDAEFVEKIAREKNMVRPDEVVFVFPREQQE